MSFSQSCPTLGEPKGCSPPGSLLGILQEGILKWVAMRFSKRSSQSRDQNQFSCISGKFCTIWAPAAVAAAAAKSLRSCPTLCDPIEGSPSGPVIPGILQARTLEWVAISFSNAWKWKVKVKSLSSVWLLATPWTAAYQAPPPVGFSRQEYWSGLPLPSPWKDLAIHKALWSFYNWHGGDGTRGLIKDLGKLLAFTSTNWGAA